MSTKLTRRKEGTMTCLFIAYACIVFRLIVRVSNVHKADFVGAGVSSAQHVDLTARIQAVKIAVATLTARVLQISDTPERQGPL